MTENNNDLRKGSDSGYHQKSENIPPEYSFWAEQMLDRTNTNINNNTDSWSNYNKVYDNTAHVTRDKKKKERKVLRFIAKAICFGLIAGASFWGVQELYYTFNPSARIVLERNGDTVEERLNLDPPSRTEIKIESTDTGPIKMTDRTVITDVVDGTIPSIVSIRSNSTRPFVWFGQEYGEEVEGNGSGIIVGKSEEELLIATNNHVVEGADQITVTFIDGSEVQAVIKGTDATADLAVISVDVKNMKSETIDEIRISKLGNSDEVKVGEMAIAIGNALGYGQSVTVGYISAKDRRVDVPTGNTRRTMILLQTDAAINPGNSGGALLNVQGEVIGINTVKYRSNEVEGMGYAIPISRAIPIINELMVREVLKPEEQGFLGITGYDVTEDVSVNLNMPMGVLIRSVDENGAARRAGLLNGDIITKLNTIEITSIMQLREKVTSLRVGTEVSITYMRMRDGEYLENTVTVTLGPRSN